MDNFEDDLSEEIESLKRVYAQLAEAARQAAALAGSVAKFAKPDNERLINDLSKLYQDLPLYK